MKIKILFLFFAATILKSTGQISFQVGNPYLILSRDVKQTADHGYILGGQLNDSLCSICDYCGVLKIDSLGREVWQKMYASAFGGYDSYTTSLFQSSDGNYVFSGCSYDGSSSTKMVISKINSSGNIIWSDEYAGTNGYARFPTYALETKDGNYAMLGNQNFGFGISISLIKVRRIGNILWSVNYDDTIQGFGLCKSFTQTSDSGFIITGKVGSNQCFLLKTDSVGNPMWYKRYSDTLYGNSGMDVKQTFDGGYIVVCSDDIYGSVAAYVIKTDANGDTLWTKAFTGVENHAGYSIEQTSDSGFIMCGAIGDNNFNTQQVFLAKLDSSGDTLWTRIYGDSSPNNKVGYCVHQTNDGGYVIAGMNSIYSHLIKTDMNGISPCNQLFRNTDIERHNGTVINGSVTVSTNMSQSSSLQLVTTINPWTISYCFSLGYNEMLPEENIFTIAPNPASDKIFINSSPVSVNQLKIFNTLGVLQFEIKNSKSEIDISSLADGIYFIQVQTEKNISIQKFIKAQ
jgi:hypothetical protein